jgi:hypothetical protein
MNATARLPAAVPSLRVRPFRTILIGDCDVPNRPKGGIAAPCIRRRMTPWGRRFGPSLWTRLSRAVVRPILPSRCTTPERSRDRLTCRPPATPDPPLPQTRFRPAVPPEAPARGPWHASPVTGRMSRIQKRVNGAQGEAPRSHALFSAPRAHPWARRAPALRRVPTSRAACTLRSTRGRQRSPTVARPGAGPAMQRKRHDPGRSASRGTWPCRRARSPVRWPHRQATRSHLPRT